MPTTVCPSCKTELQEYKRFCPECGARIAEPETTPAPIAPTMILPPVATPAADAPPRPAVAPTVRLDGLDVPPATPAPAPAWEQSAPPVAGDTPTVIGGLPPVTSPPTAELAYASALPPADAGYSGGQLPPGGASTAVPQGRRTLWWVVGGVGCLSIVLLTICAIGVLTLLGSRVEGIANTPTVVSESSGAGGIVPDNSPLTGGAVLLEDSFEDADASGLGTDEDETSRYAYESGAYVIEVKTAEQIVWAQLDGTYSNARFAVDTEIPPGADVAAAGLIFHYQDSDNFYLFSVSNDGYYALEVLEGNEWTVLIDWTQSDAVDAVRNRLQVETKGDSITLYVNDELLEATSDGTFTEGEAALAVSSLAESTAEVHFDNLLIELND